MKGTSKERELRNTLGMALPDDIARENAKAIANSGVDLFNPVSR